MTPNTYDRRNACPAWLTHGVEIALVVLLLIGFCGRIWGIGITATDDAVWALRIHQPGQHIVADFAIGQGRLWAWAGGAWVRAGLWYAGTHFADTLIVGSFLLFFALFLRAVAVYWSAATAFAAAGVFLAITVLHGDRTILTSYPGYLWMPASATITAIFAARRYQHSGGLTALIACAVMTIVGLFNNEGGTLLTMVVVPAAILANHWQAPAGSTRRTQVVMAVFAALSLVFVAATLVYRWQHPSSYGGNILAPFDLRRILQTTLGFAASGTIFYDAIDPYRQTFPDTALDLYPGITYAPRQFLEAALANPVSLTTGGLVGLLLLLVMGRPPGASAAFPLWSAATGCLCGLAIATLLVLPVAMTGQYQDWFFRYALHIYSHTIFATFGVALIVAILLNLAVAAAPRRLQPAVAVVLALGFGGIAMLSNQMNDTIMQAARPYAGRWRVLKDLLTIAHATGSDHDIIFVPRFKDEALLALVKAQYWSDYIRVRYGDPLRVTDRSLSLRDVQAGAAIADYHLTGDGRSFAVTVAHLNASGGAPPRADRITVLVEQTDPSMQNEILSFTGRQGVRQVLLRDLRQIGTRIWTLDGVDADPLSVRLGLLSFEQHLRLACGDNPSGQVLQFGAAGSGCDARDGLGDGWSRSEQDGVWTNAATATLALPTAGLPAGALTVTFDASGYPGIAPTDPPQTVNVSVNGYRAASWVSRAGAASQATPIIVAAGDWNPGTPLTVVFEIDPLYRHSPVGSRGDTRALGLYLRAVTLRPAP